MKKTLLTISLCVLLLSTPTLLAAPAFTNLPFLQSPYTASDGTFAGGIGRGHWGAGNFKIDRVNAYLTGVYTDTGSIKLSGEIRNTDDEEIGDINARIISRILIGTTGDLNGLRIPIIGFVMRNKHDQFVSRLIISSFPTSPHIWGYLVPNK
jgi:hypothetical protein